MSYETSVTNKYQSCLTKSYWNKPSSHSSYTTVTNTTTTSTTTRYYFINHMYVNYK